MCVLGSQSKKLYTVPCTTVINANKGLRVKKNIAIAIYGPIDHAVNTAWLIRSIAIAVAMDLVDHAVFTTWSTSVGYSYMAIVGFYSNVVLFNLGLVLRTKIP
jgi:hypothetical protein